MNNKEIEQGFQTLGGDLKELYNLYKKDVEDLGKQVSAIMAHITSMRMEIDTLKKEGSGDIEARIGDVEEENLELRDILDKLLAVMTEIAVGKELIKPKTPEEKLGEIIEEVAEKKRGRPKKGSASSLGVIGTCRNCNKDVQLKDVQPLTKKTASGEYIVGFCPECNGKVYKKKR